MPLGFIQDAISLSGLTGTKLKCDVIGEYYNFWWNITSGGPSTNYFYQTAIVELDAATGEVYIQDTGEIVLGSAGHALQLKSSRKKTAKLKVILIEKDKGCYSHLKKVIKRRWPNINIDDAEGLIEKNKSNVYLFNLEFEDALENLERINLGNSLFFFDPLRSVTYENIEKLANRRIQAYYQTGTEFIIFLFTSDWFLGRDDFEPLPNTPDEKKWSDKEKVTVLEADSLFGNTNWRHYILNDEMIEERQSKLIELYKERLHKWFRYVLPLPFNPKDDQLFHLMLCSNYEDGLKRTKDFYSEKTGNPRYKPDNQAAYRKFRRLHPELLKGLRGNQRPSEWRLLWSTITKHEEGVCDQFCVDYDRVNIGMTPKERQRYLQWLENKGYLVVWNVENAWDQSIRQYKINWIILKNKLGIDPPLPLKPLSPEMIKNGRI
ncbi:MAG: three-Cys-motif partner protein TcmP [Promethearchaeota archaeon]